jgi:hypothetical protein
LSEARPAVKRARLDPKVIAAWNAVCARDAVRRRWLRDAFNGGTCFGFGLLAVSSTMKPIVADAFAITGVTGIATSIGAMIWNNVLVGSPPCPACGEPIRLTGSGRGWSASHPESLEWCPHCFVWLKHPSDTHRPLA